MNPYIKIMIIYNIRWLVGYSGWPWLKGNTKRYRVRSQLKANIFSEFSEKVRVGGGVHEE